MRDLLGGKGANLAEMTTIGLPVPDGFTITTKACLDYLGAGNEWPEGLREEVSEHLASLEQRAGKRLGDPADPLLVSVRSGAPVSMPGMMDTILNLGLTWEGAEALAGETGDAAFAWGCLERLLEQFARTVRGLSAGVVEEALMDAGGGGRAGGP